MPQVKPNPTPNPATGTAAHDPIAPLRAKAAKAERLQQLYPQLLHANDRDRLALLRRATTELTQLLQSTDATATYANPAGSEPPRLPLRPKLETMLTAATRELAEVEALVGRAGQVFTPCQRTLFDGLDSSECADKSSRTFVQTGPFVQAGHVGVGTKHQRPYLFPPGKYPASVLVPNRWVGWDYRGTSNVSGNLARRGYAEVPGNLRWVQKRCPAETPVLQVGQRTFLEGAGGVKRGGPDSKYQGSLNAYQAMKDHKIAQVTFQQEVDSIPLTKSDEEAMQALDCGVTALDETVSNVQRQIAMPGYAIAGYQTGSAAVQAGAKTLQTYEESPAVTWRGTSRANNELADLHIKSEAVYVPFRTRDQYDGVVSIQCVYRTKDYTKFKSQESHLTPEALVTKKARTILPAILGAYEYHDILPIDDQSASADIAAASTSHQAHESTGKGSIASGKTAAPAVVAPELQIASEKTEAEKKAAAAIEAAAKKAATTRGAGDRIDFDYAATLDAIGKVCEADRTARPPELPKDFAVTLTDEMQQRLDAHNDGTWLRRARPTDTAAQHDTPLVFEVVEGRFAEKLTEELAEYGIEVEPEGVQLLRYGFKQDAEDVLARRAAALGPLAAQLRAEKEDLSRAIAVLETTKDKTVAILTTHETEHRLRQEEKTAQVRSLKDAINNASVLEVAAKKQELANANRGEVEAYRHKIAQLQADGQESIAKDKKQLYDDRLQQIARIRDDINAVDRQGHMDVQKAEREQATQVAEAHGKAGTERAHWLGNENVRTVVARDAALEQAKLQMDASYDAVLANLSAVADGGHNPLPLETILEQLTKADEAVLNSGYLNLVRDLDLPEVNARLRDIRPIGTAPAEQSPKPVDANS